MNVFAKFDDIPSMILQESKETKGNGHKNVSDAQSDNVKTVYPPTNTVCEGITMMGWSPRCYIPSFVEISQPFRRRFLKGF